MSQTFKDYVEQVRAGNPILPVVQSYIKVELPQKMAVCPFHPDSRPSMSIHPERGFFNCFGCHTSGDVFRFVELMDGCSFKDALTKLAARAGLPTFTPHPQERAMVEHQRAVQEVTELAALYYQQRLTDEAMAYVCDQRGFPESVLDDFRVGWADGGLVAHVRAAYGEPWAQVLHPAGLATQYQDGSLHDLLRDRVVFPALHQGRAIFLTARSMDGREPKYMHQRGLEAPLFNVDAINPGRLFVTEGPLDAISLHVWGYPVVALLGGARDSALGRLRRAKELYVCLDADRAGRESTLKLAHALGTKLRVVRLPNGQDPNDVFRSGDKAGFDQLVAQATDPVRFAVECVPLDTPPERLGTELEPTFRFLATLSPLDCEMYLDMYIRPRFKLGKEAMVAARAELARHRELADLRCPACGTFLTKRR